MPPGTRTAGSQPSSTIARRSTRGRFGELAYPNVASHGTVLTFQQYSYASGAVANSSTSGSIFLPLPQSISDSDNIQISDTELGVNGNALANALGGNAGDLASGAKGSAENIQKSITDLAKSSAAADIGGITSGLSTASSYLRYMTQAGLTSLDMGYGDAISAASGDAVNPHATLVFSGVSLKKYSFQWNLAPESESESRKIHQIIQEVKKRILPRTEAIGGGGGGSGILKYPDTVIPQFVGIDKNKTILFKRAMVTGFDVDYSPNGNVMIKGGGGSAPAFVNITMNFSEAEIHTSQDYGG